MDLIGQTFSRLTVIDNAPSSPNRHKEVSKCAKNGSISLISEIGHYQTAMLKI